MRGVCKYLVGSCLLAVLAGCARTWFAEREPWRRDAEAACLKSGAVKEGPAVSILSPIDGPGVCGAAFPLRVAALGEPAIPGFADEPVRPPGAIGGVPAAPPPYPAYPPPPPYYPAAAPYTPAQAYPPPPVYPPAQTYQQPYPQSGGPGAPLSLDPRAQGAPPRYGAEAVPLGPSPGAGAALAAGPASLTPAATLACPLVSALDRFVSESVQPAALRWFGAPVVQIKQISAYSCRGMNGNPNAKISEHAFGNALDIAAFTLADGRVVTVKDGWHGAPEEQGFLHDVQGAACSMFTTVLAPGSNAYHSDHMHVDLMRRSSGRGICEPTPISGEAAAARAGGRYSARPAEPQLYTGSATSRRASRSLAYGDDTTLMPVIPGED
jgi:hypothetical protein